MKVITECKIIFNKLVLCNIFTSVRNLNSKVPKEPFVPVIDGTKLRLPTKIDNETIAHLERLSLVDFGNEKGIEILEAAIEFADQLSAVDTTGVEPMFTVLENRAIEYRQDAVSEGNCREDIMSNAVLTEEDYFVAPPGNIPLEPKELLLRSADSKTKQTNRS